MQCKLRLSEFTSNILYKKGNLNTHPDALSQLTFLGYKTVPLEAEISTYLKETTVEGEQAAFVSESDVLHYIPLTHEACKISNWYR